MVLDIINKDWKEFIFEQIFEIYSTSSGIDRNKLINKEGKIPYITRSEKNNGYDSFICEQSHKYNTDSANVITIGLDTQTIFYQPNEFYTGQNIQILKCEALNEEIAQFLIPLIKRQMEKFNWGGNGATLSRLRRSRLLLPINEKNMPDYLFMEAFIIQKKKEKVQLYSNYLVKRLEKLELFKTIEPLDQKKWKVFEISEIFNVDKGKYLPAKRKLIGKLPFITAKAENNGISEFIGNPPIFKGNSITIEKVKLTAFYQPIDFFCSHDVTVINNEKLNEWNAKFICYFINRNGLKYNYGRQAQMNVVKREKIMLPVNNRNEPDYDYMENYIKVLESKKIKEYMKFKNGEIII